MDKVTASMSKINNMSPDEMRAIVQEEADRAINAFPPITSPSYKEAAIAAYAVMAAAVRILLPEAQATQVASLALVLNQLWLLETPNDKN
jgi:N-acetyl-beta-hexosaminidase